MEIFSTLPFANYEKSNPRTKPSTGAAILKSLSFKAAGYWRVGIVSEVSTKGLASAAMLARSPEPRKLSDDLRGDCSLYSRELRNDGTTFYLARLQSTATRDSIKVDVLHS
jgi:hypothetical protein